MFRIVMAFAPVGAFAAMAYTVGTFGVRALLPLARLLLDDPHFHVEEWTVSAPCQIEHDSRSFLILFPVNGDVRIKTPGQPAMILQHGNTCLLPAILNSFTLQPAKPGNGAVRVLVTRRP